MRSAGRTGRTAAKGRHPARLVLAALAAVLLTVLVSPGTSDAEEDANNPAEGRPEILVEAGGLSLYANPRGISDDDGLPAPGNPTVGGGYHPFGKLNYEWFRIDPATNTRTSIASATETKEGHRYVLTDDDVGHLIEVTVTFADKKSNIETVTSVPYGPVPDRTGPPSRPPVTLVSNLGQPASAAFTAAGNYDVAFRLGKHGQGYEINSVTIDFDQAPTDVTVSMWIAGLNKYAFSTVRRFKLFDFTNPDTLTSGLNKFTAPVGAFAYQNVNYYIRMEGFGGGSVSIIETASDAEDAGGEPGAVIFDTASQNGNTRGSVLRMAVEGSKRDSGILVSTFTVPFSGNQEIISQGDMAIRYSFGTGGDGADYHLWRSLTWQADDSTSAQGGICNPIKVGRFNMSPSRFTGGLSTWTAPRGTIVGSTGAAVSWDIDSRECGILVRMQSPNTHAVDVPNPLGAVISNLNANISLADGVIAAAVDGEPLYAMVSNIDQTNASYVTADSTNPFVTQGFRTGPHPGGYRFRGVGIHLVGSDSKRPDDHTAVRVSVWTDSGGNPQQKVFDLTSPGRYYQDEVHFFEAPWNAMLEPHTSYVVVWEHRSGTEHRLRRTTSNAEDSRAKTLRGFSIADAFHRGSALNSLEVDSGGHSLEIQVYGEANRPDPGPHVTAGGYHTCTLDRDGDVGCAGRNAEGQRNPPPLDADDEWTHLSAGEFHTCGLVSDTKELRTGGAIKCWGDDTFDQVTDTPTDDGYVALDAGPWHTCAMKADGEFTCWGGNEDGQSVSGQFDGDTFKVGQITDAGIFQETTEPRRGSKLTKDMGIVDWIDVPSGAFPVAVSAGGSVLGLNTNPRTTHSYTCVLWSDGTIGCAGTTWWDWAWHASRSESGDTDKPDHEPCVGECVYPEPTQFGILWAPDPPAGSRYTSVSVGGKHACATVSDGTIRCWGAHYHDVLGDHDDQDEVKIPVLVDYGKNKDNKEMRRLNQAVSTIDPPAGADRWDAVSAGRHHTCGTAAGEIYCWGNQRFLTAMDPGHPGLPSDSWPDKFGEPRSSGTTGARLPSVGHWHSCWVHGPASDPKGTCMGDQDFGQSRLSDRAIRNRPVKTVTAVSNLAQSTHANSLNFGNGEYAIRIWSGASDAGFELTSVVLEGRQLNRSSGYLELSVWSTHTPTGEMDERPKEQVCALRSPLPFTGLRNRFDVTGGCKLAASKAYWLVGREDLEGSTVLLARTDSNDQDSGHLSGWFIGDEMLSRAASETGEWSGSDVTTSTSIPQLSLQGYDRAGSLSVFDASAHESDDRTLDFIVTLIPAVDDRVKVDYATSDGTATAGADYTATRGTLTFGPRQTVKKIRVPIIDDNVEDDGETLTLTLSNATGGAKIVDGTATGTITNTEADTGSGAVMLVGEFQDMPLGHDGSSAFTTSLELSDEVSISASDLKDHAFKVTGGSITAVRRSADAPNRRFELTVQPNSNDPVTVALAEKPDCGARGAVCTSDGRMLFTLLSVAVDGPPDAPDTGLPTISGLTVLDQTLTADVSGITDSEGLTATSFTYQWVRMTDHSQGDIAGATGAAYTLTQDDVGKRIRVRVRYTDDANNTHSLTSAATERVTKPKLGTVKLTDGTETTAEVEVTLTGSQGVAIPVYVGYKTDESGADWTIVEGKTDPTTGKAIITLTGLTEHTPYNLRASMNRELDPFLFDIFTAGRTARAVEGDWADGPPGAPGTPTIERGDLQLTVTWTPPEDNGTAPVIDYRVELRREDQSYAETRRWASVTHPEVTHTFTNLANGVTYYVRVMARNSDEIKDGGYVFGPASEEASGVPGTGTVGLATPVLSEPEYLHHLMVRLDWQDIEGADWYEVQYHHPHSNKWVDLPHGDMTIAHHGSSAVLSGLHEGYLWYVRVRALGCGGPSGWSEIMQMSSGAASDWTDVDVPEVAEGDTRPEASGDCPATGAPTISGTAQAGETLTADTSGITDTDGLTNVSFSFQWMRSDGDTDSDIQGATASTYDLVDDDVGKTIKVRVSFTDDQNNQESLTSTATADVTARSNNPATGQPAISGTAQAGETLTATTSGIEDTDGLDDVSYSYQWIRSDGTTDSDIQDATASTYTLTDDDAGKTIKVRVTFTDDDSNQESLTSAATGTVAARPNIAATGAPTISGTVREGETLAASTSGIADDDGLDDVSYSYQWIRSDGTTDSDIQDATTSTYTLTSDDVGKAIKVRVTFTDDRDNNESLTSAATAAVTAKPLTASVENAPASHDGSEAFTFELQFSENIRMGFRTLRDHVFDVTEGTITKARRSTQGSNVGWEITVDPSGNADVTITLPATTDCSAQGAVCTHGGKKLSDGLKLTINGPGE